MGLKTVLSYENRLFQKCTQTTTISTALLPPQNCIPSSDRYCTANVMPGSLMVKAVTPKGTCLLSEMSSNTHKRKLHLKVDRYSNPQCIYFYSCDNEVFVCQSRSKRRCGQKLLVLNEREREGEFAKIEMRYDN